MSRMTNEDDDRFDVAMKPMSLIPGPEVEEEEDDYNNQTPSKAVSRGVGNDNCLGASSFSKSQEKNNKIELNDTTKSFFYPELQDEGSSGPVENIEDLPVFLLRRILNYLRLWDISSCRIVCKKWNDQILNHTLYLQKSFILLTPDRLQMGSEEIPQLLKEFNPLFCRMRMLRVPQSHLLPCYPPTFSENLVHLELFHCGPMTWPIFIDILTSCPKLEELTVRKSPFKWPYDLEEWRNKYAEFSGQIHRSGKSFPILKGVEFRVKDPHDVLLMFRFLLEHSTSLQRLSFSCKSPQAGLKLDTGNDDVDDMYETIHEMFDVLVQILKKFGKTLEIFHSYLIDPPQTKTTPLIGPATRSKSRHNLDQSNKEEPTIMNTYCSKVLSRLEMDKMKLKSFCLYGGEISSGNIPHETNILGAFIASQKSLEKVILPRMRFQTEREFQAILRNIPKLIKCIRVPTFGRMPECLSFEFHKLTEYYIEAHGTPDLQVIVPPGTILPNVKTFSFYNCSDWVWQTVRIMTVINSFPCLTELLIRDDGTHQCTRIGDSDMQNICRYLPHLKKLHMTNVDCVTDFGFSGICEKECRLMNETEKYVPSPGTKIGYSISTLKNLEYLCLLNIGFRVTNVSMIFGFIFPTLRFMTLEGYPKVTPWGVEYLKNNNSKLKRWNLQFHDASIDQVVEKLQQQQTSSYWPKNSNGQKE